MSVDVQWIRVIGFPVWFVFCVVQVESNISKFTTFKFTSAVIFR
jgi:hypothetical protein